MEIYLMYFQYFVASLIVTILIGATDERFTAQIKILHALGQAHPAYTKQAGERENTEAKFWKGIILFICVPFFDWFFNDSYGGCVFAVTYALTFNFIIQFLIAHVLPTIGWVIRTNIFKKFSKYW